MALIGCLAAGTMADGQVRVMPLGDSITEGIGSTNDNGYRKPLYLELVDANWSIDFVGSQISGDFADPDHEGHAGWQANEILDGHPNEPAAGKLADWLVAHQPDIVLLHIGSNDITVGGQDANEVSDILDEIDGYSDDVTVILALIIDRQPHSPATTQFNIDVNNMAQNRIAAGDDIIIVDMEHALDYNDSNDMVDYLHPNDSGYAKMADVWYEALTGSLRDGLYETNQRLEFVSSSRFGDFRRYYTANGWRIDANESFAFKADFHYSDLSSAPGWVGMDICDGANYVSISAGANGDAAYFYYEATVDGNIIMEQESRESDDGTLYCRYDANSNAVYLSHIGFDSNDAYVWQTTPDPLQGQWLSSLDIALGGGSDHVYLGPGQAYLENFQITDAGLLDWPPETDLDHNGYIELPDLADLCEYWLQTGTGMPADFYPDGTVDLQDFSILGLAW